MKVDLGTRDNEYETIVSKLHILRLAGLSKDNYAVVWLQGCGTYGVESVLASSVRKSHKVLILSNGGLIVNKTYVSRITLCNDQFYLFNW